MVLWIRTTSNACRMLAILIVKLYLPLELTPPTTTTTTEPRTKAALSDALVTYLSRSGRMEGAKVDLPVRTSDCSAITCTAVTHSPTSSQLTPNPHATACMEDAEQGSDSRAFRCVGVCAWDSVGELAFKALLHQQ